jgi:flagellar basal-body rod protein FlgF
MDDLIYTALSGAKALMARQDVLTHNLANVGTSGFRADMTTFRAVPVVEDGTSSTRVFNIEATAGYNSAPGPVTTTDRPLDVAIRGAGWFVVQTPDGGEAYTRNGGFTMGADGSLQTGTGLLVMGDGGPIVLPANATVSVGSDGTISARIENQAPIQVGRLRLVNPEPASLQKGPDGLLRSVSGEPAADDAAVRVAGGVLEGSNVNVVESMVGMIELARQFEIQMRLLQNAESNDQRAASLLSLTS